jgi:similar to stage IV sporulation protein
VVEKNTPEQTVETGPQHLVAKKEAVITKILVEKGKQLVNRHDHVVKGQMLVSGLIGKEGQTEKVAATGEIKGETWYKSVVELPLKSNFQVFNGNEKRKFLLKLGDFSVPIWGFGDPKFKQFEMEENSRHLHFLHWDLPISYVNKTFRERENVTRVYSNKEAIAKAKEIAIKDIKNRLSEDATIIGEKILHQTIENGKVKLSLHFQIVENIAEGQPIIQGDDE